MNRTLSLVTALGAGLALAPFAVSQTAAAPAVAAPAAAVAPQAVPAKIALINFEQVVLASNEGQTVTVNTQAKFAPKAAEIEKLNADVDALKKSLDSAPATLPDAERANRLRSIDVKQKQLNRDAEDTSTEYNTEWQQGLNPVAQKMAAAMKKYAADNGFTILLDVSSQQANGLWALPSTDISQAVVDLYNKQSGVAGPPPQAPRPAGGRPAVAPRPSTAKPPVK